MRYSLQECVLKLGVGPFTNPHSPVSEGSKHCLGHHAQGYQLIMVNVDGLRTIKLNIM